MRPPPGPLSRVVICLLDVSRVVVVRCVVVKSCVLFVSRVPRVVWQELSLRSLVVLTRRVVLGALVLNIRLLYLVVVSSVMFVWVNVLVFV